MPAIHLRHLLATAAVLAVSHSASALSLQTLDLSTLSHGVVVSGQTIDGVTIGVNNFRSNRGLDPGQPDPDDLAVIFDSSLQNTRDADLESPFSVGNLVGSPLVNEVGNLIIIQEFQVDPSTDGPDDEGRRPAGNLFFDFEQSITSFGLDLIDVEGRGEFDDLSGFVATFVRSADNGQAAQEFRVGFGELVDQAINNRTTDASTFFDSTVVFGDNSANRIRPIRASDFGVAGFDSFDRVVLNLGGSAGIANVNFVVTPSPAAASIGLLGALGLVCRPRRGRA